MTTPATTQTPSYTQMDFVIQAGKTAASLSMIPSVPAGVPGELVTFNVEVAGNGTIVPSGTVSVYEALATLPTVETLIGTFTIANTGQAEAQYTIPANVVLGTYIIKAVYNGDDLYY